MITINFRLFVITTGLLLASCQAPFLTFAGKALEGPVEETDSFEFAADYQLLRLEVNPDAPYSVILRSTVIDEHLYIDAASRRQWGRYLAQNPCTRIQLGEKIYPAMAEQVNDQEVLKNFSGARIVYRMIPRLLSNQVCQDNQRNR